MSNLADDKQQLRREMRRKRKDLTDRAERSARIWERVRALPVVESSARLLIFDTIAGEPHTAPFIEWCESVGKTVAAPEDDVDPSWPDIVIVPGLAFARSGERVGQGGGWYDRFLARTRDECVSIGVCFSPQVLDAVPTEDHDVRIDVVISD